MQQQRIKEIIQRHIDEGRPEQGLLQLLSSIAHGRPLTAEEEPLREFVIALHGVLGQAVYGSLVLAQVPPDEPDQALRVAAMALADAAPAELRALYTALGRLLYGDTWQPAPGC